MTFARVPPPPNPLDLGSALDPLVTRLAHSPTSTLSLALLSHPQIRAFLKNKQWETRIAAAKTISHICEGIRHATVSDVARLAGVTPESAAASAVALPSDPDEDAATDLTFDEFDIVGVLERAAPLLASKAADFDASSVDDAKLSKAERLRLAKQSLRKRLGMALETEAGNAEKAEGKADGKAEGDGGAAEGGTNLNVDKFIDVDDLVGEEDVDEVNDPAGAGGASSGPAAPAKVDATDLSQLSARERNRLKRKQKRGARDEAQGVAPAPKRGRPAKNAAEMAALAAETAEEEEEAAEVENGAWPLQRTCESLAFSLFAPRWEERHGAAAALREVLRHHAAYAGVAKPEPRATSCDASLAAVAAKRNAAWLEDMAVRLLCLLSLDRFGDYVGDGVVAPVRETGAQALGAGLGPLPPAAVEAVTRAILVLLRRPEWEVRHSALLALRYVLAARASLAPRLLPAALPAAVKALDDKDDDVRGGAAEALFPAATHLPSHPEFPPLLSGLWGLLKRLDDPDLLTSPSNVPIMRLICALYKLPETQEVPPVGPNTTLADVVPSLFPFAAHPIAGVRLGVWSTLRQLVNGGSTDWLAAVVSPVLRLLFQAVLLEEDAETAAAASAAWSDVLDKAPGAAVSECVKSRVGSWCQIAATATGARPDARLLFVVSLGAGDTTGADERAHISTSEWTVATVGRLRAVDALSKLGAALAGDVDAAASLERETTTLLESGGATKRMTGALLLARWLDAFPPGTAKPGLAAPGARLGALLAATNPAYPSAPSPAPYAEAKPFADRVKTEAAGLLRAAAEAGLKPTTSEVPSPAADGFGAEHAGVLANAIPKVKARRARFFPPSNQRGPPARFSIFQPRESGTDRARRTFPAPRDRPRRARGRFGSIRISGRTRRARVSRSVASTPTSLRPGDTGFPGLTLAGGKVLSPGHSRSTGFSSPPIVILTSTKTSLLCSRTHQGPPRVETVRSSLAASAARLRAEETQLHGSTLAAAAGAAVAFGALPPKLNPFIQPLMHGVRRERDALLQRRSASSLASLVALCEQRVPSPVNKITGNVIAMACADPAETPRLEWDDSAIAVAKNAAAANEAAENAESEAKVARRGAEAVLRALTDIFAERLFDAVPKTWEAMSAAKAFSSDIASGAPVTQAVVDGIQILKTIGPFALTHGALGERTRELVEPTFVAATRPEPALRTVAASALAALAKASPDALVPKLLELVVPALEDAGEADSASAKRRGAAAVASALVQTMGPDLAPFCVLLLVPLMGRMSDPTPETRELATRSFAALVPLLPLARGRDPPAGLSAAQKERSDADGAFLEALLDNSKVENFELPFACTRTLRPYQQEGVNWLAFLRRFKLHGALCDDMGLGKTLQSTCILAATVVERRNAGLPALPALVVCPPTLVGHWAHEIEQYVASDVLRPLQYHGNPGERAAIRPRIDDGSCDVVIMSYDSLRADQDDLLPNRAWCYCILDEGHAIRNPKSRVTQAVKRVRADHRLLLSGTPIQNDVVELWSLFDFLMPGFLGTEREFRATYGVAASRSVAAKKGGGLTEAGALATGRLHKQVMPFVMRRVKDEVLKDLPPKIIQDVFVDLSAYQKRLYDAFEASSAKTEAVEAVTKREDTSGSVPGEDGKEGTGTAHVFQALQYLRKLCSHPRLVQPGGVGKRGTPEQTSPKFVALKQILLDCGVGVDATAEPDPDGGAARPAGGGAGAHRVLIFTQLKSLLDLVEEELFGSMMRGVSWLRLDGSVAPTARFDVVRKFNSDPSIDVLLLTTHVGGLGLNLTSADTVVFLEHDWNPQKDLQAMDRAHRLGQKRTVNVYRLLTKGTLEEKIMGLQRFKLDVANAVVNSDNMSLSAMDTGQMLELFTTDKGGKAGKDEGAAAKEGGAAAVAADAVSGGMKAALAGLDELWDENQYKEEFALDGFIKSLGGEK